MDSIFQYVESNVIVAWIVIIVAFAFLAKCADWFVEGSIALAEKFHIPKIIIGIILVSVATSSPELAVSLSAALGGSPEMALGNAIGSVICDDGLALAAAGITCAAVIPIFPLILRISGLFLLFIELLTFLFVAFDNTLSTTEGIILVFLLTGYLTTLLRLHKKGKFTKELAGEISEIEEIGTISNLKMILFFLVGLGGIILSSNFIVTSAKTIALSFGIPAGIISMILVAFGTSIPEIATSITAVRKNQGALAFGNVIGSDIINLCLVGGGSAIVNDLVVSKSQIFLMFPSMIVISTCMLLAMRKNYNLTRKKGLFLFALYLVYLVISFVLFPPQ